VSVADEAAVTDSDALDPMPAGFVAERFWSRVDKREPEECWRWMGAHHSHGYGQMRFAARTHYAHRLSLWLATGKKPTRHVLHACDNPECVNPHHLREGTPADNLIDAFIRGRKTPSALPVHVQPRGQRHGIAKLRDDQIPDIRRARAAGESASSIAARFKMSTGAIRCIVRRASWSHIP